MVLLVAGFGWAKPVPVNPYALERRSPAAMMWVSLAGPLTNLLLAILAAIPFRLGLVSVAAGFAPSAGLLPNFDKVMVQFVTINLLLALFNLIPLAPLDGEKIASYFLPPNIGRFMDTIRPYGPMILLVLVLSGSLLGFDLIGRIIGPPLVFLFGLLVG
jgi:Zn-dependent protease